MYPPGEIPGPRPHGAGLWGIPGDSGAGVESQRAMIAAKIANMPDHRPSKSANLPTSPVSQTQAAELLNVSERTVRNAKSVQEHGAKELVKAVEDGKIAVSVAAKIANLPNGVRKDESSGRSIELPASQSDAATLMNVSVPSLKRAKSVQEHGQMLEQKPTNKGTLLRGTKMEPREDTTPTLSEQGLDKKISSRSKLLAKTTSRKVGVIDNGSKKVPLLARHREEIVKKQAKENQKTSTGGVNPRPSAKLPKAAIDTRKILAKSAGVGERKIIFGFPIDLRGARDENMVVKIVQSIPLLNLNRCTRWMGIGLSVRRPGLYNASQFPSTERTMEVTRNGNETKTTPC